MAEKRVIEIDVNTASAVKNVDLLSQSFEDVYGEIQPLSGRMGELEDQLYELANAGKQGTEEFETLSAEVGRMKKVIQQTDMTVDALAKTTSQKLGGALSFVSGGFSTFQGAMGAVGVDSQALEETILKVQSAMAITQGIDSMREGYKDVKALTGDLAKNLAKTAIGQKLVTVAQLIGATAMKVLNAVMKANPIFLIIGGITALVGAFALFSGSSEDAAESNEKLTRSLEKQRQVLDDNFDSLQKQQGRRLELLKANGASAKQIFEQEQRDTKKNAEEKRKAFLNEGESYKKLKARYKVMMAVGNEDEAAKIREQLKTSAQRYKTLGKQAKDYFGDLKHNKQMFDAEQEAEDKEKAKEAAEKQKERNEKAKQKQLEAEQKKNEELAEIARAQLEATKTQSELEIIDTEAKYNKLIALAKKHGKETKDLEAQKLEEVNAIKTKKFEDEQKVIEEANQKRIDLEDKQFKLQQELTQTAQEKEIADLVEQYEAKFELANGNAELEKQLTEKQKQDIAAINDKYRLEQKTKDDADAETKKAREKSIKDFWIDSAIQTFNLLGELSQTFAGNSEKAQRRAFNIQKAANIASTLLETYKAAQSAYASQITPGDPSSLIRGAVAAGIATASGLGRVAQIAKTQFNSSSSNAGGGGDNGAGSLPQQAQQAPQFNIVGNASANPLAQLGNAPMQAYVVSGEVTSAQSLERNRIKSATL